jgi:glycosyltransferase involved in cell wall biosynthesis
VLSLARTLNRDRFRHSILSINGPQVETEQYNAFYCALQTSGAAIHNLGQQPRNGSHAFHLYQAFRAMITKIRRVREFIRDASVDLIDAHLESANALGAIAGVVGKRPVVATLYHPRPLVPTPMWRTSGQLSLTCANRVVTDSRTRATEIQKWMLAPPSKVCVIPNGICPPRADKCREQMLKDLDLPESSSYRVVAQIAALVRFKGQLTLLEAARRVLDNTPNVLFLIVGYLRSDRTYRAVLENRAKELGIAPWVRIVSYPGPIGNIWSVVNIHVHASEFDSLPNAIIEAMSLARPSVVTNVGGIPEAVTNGVTGLIVPPNSPDALADCILRLLNEPDLAVRLGNAAHDRYRHCYTAEIMTRRLEEIFGGLVQQRSS